MTTDAIEFVRGTVAPMAELTFPCVTSIVGIVSSEEGEHLGSGFRCLLGGRRVLVTAKHVVDHAQAAQLGAGYTAAREQPPTQLPSTPTFADPATDLAVFALNRPPEGNGIDWWPQDRVDTDKRARAHDYLFVHGFPGVRARFLFAGLHSKSLPYGVMERDDDLPDDLRAHEFAMDYDPRNMLLTPGMTADFVDPSGLSGSPVFRIGAYQVAASEWRPSNARLVGIVTRWNHDKRVLLATGAAQLLRLAGVSGT
jgi:Trypsin-like peptidase domain